MTEQEKCANENQLIIDALKKRFSLKNNVAVANFLGLNRQTVHTMTKGNFGLSIDSRVIIMNALNCSGIENLSQKITVHYLTTRMTETIGLKACENKSLIDLFKTHQGIKTDDEMAELIGIKRNSISAVRIGKAGFGPLPRLKMLSIIDNISVNEVQKGLASNEELLRMIMSPENEITK